jgi:hypothetical protein
LCVYEAGTIASSVGSKKPSKTPQIALQHTLREIPESSDAF